MTAHRCLTVGEARPDHLGPGALTGRTVLVAGGGGAVGHAAIQLARWSGARVVATVSGPAKESLARAAGAGHVVNYRSQDAAAQIRPPAPAGVDTIVEVAPAVNAALDQEILAPGGTVAVYATDGGRELTVSVSSLVRAERQLPFRARLHDAAQRQTERGRRHLCGTRRERPAGRRISRPAAAPLPPGGAPPTRTTRCRAAPSARC